MVEPHGNEGLEKLTPWTPTREISEILKGSYGRMVKAEYAWAIFGNLIFVQAFKDCEFKPPISCYATYKLNGQLFNGTFQAGESAMWILK